MPAQEDDSVTTIDLLRHGACQGGDIYRGRTDVVLSAEGWQQMEQAISSAAGWHRVVTSPLLRCRTFAEHCAEQRKLPLEIIPDLQEVDFGAWEGQPVQQVWQANPDLLARYYDDPGTVTPPGGERTADAQQRVVHGWRTLLRDFAGEHLLLVCHGGVMRMLLAHVLGMPLRTISRLYIPYASLSRVRVYHRESDHYPVLMTFNAGSGPP